MQKFSEFLAEVVEEGDGIISEALKLLTEEDKKPTGVELKSEKDIEEWAKGLFE